MANRPISINTKKLIYLGSNFYWRTLTYLKDCRVQTKQKRTQKQSYKTHPLLVLILLQPQGQYWAGRTLPPNNRPPNMATANFVMAEGCGLNGTAVAAVSIAQ